MKEMKVYVDKGKLESHDIQSITDLGGKEFHQVRMWFKDTDNVEILSLADYTKQVRKEICEKIREKILNHFNVKSEEEYEKSLSLLDALFTADVVFEILDQIQVASNYKKEIKGEADAKD